MLQATGWSALVRSTRVRRLMRQQLEREGNRGNRLRLQGRERNVTCVVVREVAKKYVEDSQAGISN